MGLKDQILKADDLPLEKIDVPEWGCSVWLRSLTAREKDEVGQLTLKLLNDGVLTDAAIAIALVGRCLCDENGVRLFKDTELDKLGQKSAKVLEQLFQFARHHNGIGEDALEQLGGN